MPEGTSLLIPSADVRRGEYGAHPPLVPSLISTVALACGRPRLHLDEPCGLQDVAVARDGDSDSWMVTVTAANEGYLDTSMEQARRARVAQPDRVTLMLKDGVTTADPLTVEFPFMRGTRGSDFVSTYRASWTVKAAAGAGVTVRLSSEKGGTDLREVILR